MRRAFPEPAAWQIRFHAAELLRDSIEHLIRDRIEEIGKGEPIIAMPDAEAIQILKDCRRRVATDS
jgi:hypothetical protein